jgi:hypothetical protein
VLKDWKPGDVTLMGGSLLKQRNLYIHVRN